MPELSITATRSRKRRLRRNASALALSIQLAHMWGPRSTMVRCKVTHSEQVMQALGTTSTAVVQRGSPTLQLRPRAATHRCSLGILRALLLLAVRTGDTSVPMGSEYDVKRGMRNLGTAPSLPRPRPSTRLPPTSIGKATDGGRSTPRIATRGRRRAPGCLKRTLMSCLSRRRRSGRSI